MENRKSHAEYINEVNKGLYDVIVIEMLYEFKKTKEIVQN